MKILQEILVPQESVNDQTLIVVALCFANGDKVKKDDIVIELETSKAIITLEAETDGYVIYHCKVDDEVPLNALIVQIADSKPKSSIANGTVVHKEEIKTTAAGRFSTQIFDTQFSKKALALMDENNLAKDLFKNYDFVNEAVIVKYLNPGQPETKLPEPVKETQAPAKPKPAVKSADFLSKVTLEKLSSAKRREIEYLSAVQSSGLVSTLHVDIDIKGIIESISDQFTYFKDSLLPVVIFETSRLLLKYPLLNAFYDEGQVARYKNVNIGIAIDIDDGLKVVKIPDTAQLGMLEVENKIFELSNKYLDKKLEVGDFTDITFTITDLSSSGTYLFSPLVNKNNSAILGISKINKKSGYCILSLAFDHRVTSGKYAGSFLAELKTRIESFALSGRKTLSVLECYKCLKNISEDENDIGFIKVQTRDGEEKLICDTCLFKF